MTASPPKLKAALAAIKDKYVDQTLSDTGIALKGLFTAELLLRGVIVQDEKKLFQQVHSSIGKMILSESSTVPSPLLAGANVMAGRIAEACATQLDFLNKHTKKFGNQVDDDGVSSALERAKGIKDKRWLVLLKQDFDPLHVALGYFTTAALIQTNTPPMWKKVWDTWCLRKLPTGEDSTPFEAQIAVERLIRIAYSKGNVKREADLKLCLVQCLLNKNRFPETSLEVQKVFGDTITETLPSDEVSIAKSALETINTCATEKFSASDMMLYKILTVQAGLELEAATTRKLADDQYQVDKNRSVSTTIEQCLENQRKIVMSSSDDTLHVSANILRDAAASSWPTFGDDSRNDSESVATTTTGITCSESLKRCILRLKDRANAAAVTAQKERWENLFDFILPIVSAIMKQCEWSIDIPRKTRLQQIHHCLVSAGNDLSLTVLIAHTVPYIYWMLLAYPRKENIDEIIKFDLDLVSVLLKLVSRQDGQQKSSSADSAVVGQKQKGISEMSLLTQARWANICYICQDNNDIIFQVTQEATSSKKSKDGSSYVSFLQCLVAWSGWFQRPWPYCSSISDARKILNSAKTGAGRSLSTIEQCLFDLAQADAELLNGGLVDVATKLYTKVIQNLESLEENQTAENKFMYTILIANSKNGLARIAKSEAETSSFGSVESLAGSTLKMLDPETKIDDVPAPNASPLLHMWYLESLVSTSVVYGRSVARQLTAESLVRHGRYDEAQELLEAAVDDSPLDADASLALGAFLLRTSLFDDDDEDDDDDDESDDDDDRPSKEAQLQLLRSAKLDSTRADPFALLGIWFEERDDLQRAQGCFTKSLSLDPCNPIAGRGLLRLVGREEMQDQLDIAINEKSSLNGWAWRAVGLNKAYSEGNAELAVVALLKSLRCRDVAVPHHESLGVFYQGKTDDVVIEKSEALSDVAMCYRRLGRYTASIRAYQAAIEAAGEIIPVPILCSCAQVELELGLFDEAVEKFRLVLKPEENDEEKEYDDVEDDDKSKQQQQQKNVSHTIAAHGQGVALLSIAQRDLQDGKAGSAYSSICQAIKSCEDLASSDSFACMKKLIGDLYSFGASLPPSVFVTDDDDDDLTESDEKLLLRQVEFVQKGEMSYRSKLQTNQVMMNNNKSGEEDKNMIENASCLCDIGSNLLLQVQIVSNHHEPNVLLSLHDSKTISSLQEQAADEFQKAIDIAPLYAPAWCGLGCAVATVLSTTNEDDEDVDSRNNNTLLAQHAFCRALQLEQMFPDAFANIGFLYTSHGAYDASESTMNGLTQIADTPMMWINRAYMLERMAKTRFQQGNDNDSSVTAATNMIQQAADAFRAALQVTKYPDAQLGLSMTGRMGSTIAGNNSDSDSRNRKESLALIREYIGSSMRLRRPALLLEGLMSIEQASTNKDTSWSRELYDQGIDVSNEHVNTNEVKTYLNTDLINNCLEAKSEEEKKDDEKDVSGTALFHTELSLQRQILHEPNRPELWLELAKDLALHIDEEKKDSGTPSSSSSSSTVLDTALTAAKRAYSIYSSMILSDTRLSTGKSGSGGEGGGVIEARLVSETLSLVHWLQTIKKEQSRMDEEDEKVEKDEDEKEEEKKVADEGYGLQLALMLAPNNALARNALQDR